MAQAGRNDDGKDGAAPSAAAQKGVESWEWVVAVAGGMFVLAVIGYLGWYSIAHDDAPPDLDARVLSVAPTANGQFAVKLEARNRGYSTAAAVRLEGELRRNGEVIERSETEIQYVPLQSRQQVTLLFSTDPRTHDLVLRFKGYSRP